MSDIADLRDELHELHRKLQSQIDDLHALLANRTPLAAPLVPCSECGVPIYLTRQDRLWREASGELHTCAPVPQSLRA